MKLKDKVTVMTGAGCGYGMSTGFPEAFAREGSHLVLNYYRESEEGMQKFKEKLRRKWSKGCSVRGRYLERGNGKKMLIQTAIDTFGRVDILINNAGISTPMRLVDMSLADWQRMIDVDLTSVYLTCREAVPHMIRQKFGRIINIASQVGQKGSVEHCHYAAAKAGVNRFYEIPGKGSWGIRDYG